MIYRIGVGFINVLSEAGSIDGDIDFKSIHAWAGRHGRLQEPVDLLVRFGRNGESLGYANELRGLRSEEVTKAQ